MNGAGPSMTKSVNKRLLSDVPTLRCGTPQSQALRGKRVAAFTQKTHKVSCPAGGVRDRKMGLIIVPVVVFWLAALFFTCRAGFYWMVDKALFPDGALLLLAAITTALLYVFFGLRRFRARSKVWAFEIPCFFLLNKYAFAVFACAAAAHYFGGAFFASDVAKALMFFAAFAVAFGNVLGCFSSGVFIKRYNITETY